MTTNLPKKRTTIADVAAAVGVTKSTVSLALAGKGNFTEARRKEILRMARVMNYEPSPHAQRLVTGRFEKMIGLFTLSLDLNVGTRKLQFLQSKLSAAGFEVPIYAYGDYSQAAGQVQLMKSLCLQRPRAIVCNTDGISLESIELLSQFQADGGIVVCYDQPTDLDCDRVVFDREDNTYQVARHLLELGHRDIAVADPPSAVESSRFHGFSRALSEFGVLARSGWMLGEEIQPGAEPFSDVYEENGLVMAQRFLQLSPRPSAVVIMDDYTAVAFAAELERHGVRVPQDVSIVSHDDSPIARCGPLQLTTVTHPVRAITDATIDLLASRLHEPQAPARKVVIRGELQVRHSAIPFNKYSISNLAS